MRIFHGLLALLSIFTITNSCSKDVHYEEVGEYHIEYNVKFTSGGGEKRLVIKDNMEYRARFDYGFDEMILHEFTRELVNPVRPKGEAGDSLDGEWYHGVLPDKGKSTIAVISADKNKTNKERKAIIEGETYFSGGRRKSFRIVIIQE